MAHSARQPLPFLAWHSGVPLSGATLTDLVNAINGAPVPVYTDRTGGAVMLGEPVSDGNGEFPGYVESDDMEGSIVHLAGTFPARYKHNDTLLNVRHFGARGDGVADDYAAIQETMDAAQVMDGWVYIPPGDYMVDVRNIGSGGHGPLQVRSGMRIMGDGETSRLFKKPGSTHPIFACRTPEPEGYDIVIRDLQCDYTNDVDILGSGGVIKITPEVSGARVLIENVTIRNVPLPVGGTNGMQAIWVGNLDDVAVRGCYFENCDRDAIHVDDCTNFQVTHNQINYTGGNDPSNPKDGTGMGDDCIAVLDSRHGVIANNVLHCPNQGRGRGIWIVGSRHIAVVGNAVRAGWQNNLAIWGGYDDSPIKESSDIAVVGNLFSHAGEWCTSASWGDAVKIDGVTDTAAGTACRRILIADNTIINPRKNGIQLSSKHANSRLEHIVIRGNVGFVDRALTHYDNSGRFIYADMTLAGQTGAITDVQIEGNRSDSFFAEGVHIKGSPIQRVRAMNEAHYDCGRVNPNQKASYLFDAIVGLHMDGCVGADYSGEARSDFGARFTNLTGRVRIINNDWIDTVGARCDWNGSTPATYVKRDNFPDTDLP